MEGMREARHPSYPRKLPALVLLTRQSEGLNEATLNLFVLSLLEYVFTKKSRLSSHLYV